MIAGLDAGYICPNCQTADEDLEAELNLMLGRSEVAREIQVNGPEDLTADKVAEIVDSLVSTYPTPEVMKDEASQLARARGDGFWMVGLMRMVARDMESGELYED
jgi:hypothetical protein